MSDEELDNLFKEAAEGYKVSDDPAAWKDMSARLDEAGRPASFWNWRAIAISALIGLTGVSIGWYLYTGSKTDVQSQPEPLSRETRSRSAENQATELTENSPDMMSSSEINGSINTEEGITQAVSSVKVDKPAVKKLESVRNDINKYESVVTKAEDKDIRNQKMDGSSTLLNPDRYEGSMQLTGNKQESSGVLALDASSAGAQNKNNGENKLTDSLDEKDALAARADRAYSSDSLLNDTLSTTLLVAVPFTDSLSSGTKKSREKGITAGQSISFKFSVSPDFSSIEMFSPDQAGINYGVLAGYNFNNRWSVFTGAISSRKIYSSTQIDDPYTTSGGYDYPVEELEGDCRVLDIPVNVYYSFYRGQSITVRAGLGLSSYLMLSEDYTYYLDKSYGSDVYSQHIEKENIEWFKIANLSLVMQKRLSEKFYLEIEPFMKVPLSGIGEGDVSLVSMGAFLNLRYDLSFKNKR